MLDIALSYIVNIEHIAFYIENIAFDIETWLIQGDFFHWYPSKKLKYGKPRLGESTLT